MTDQTAALRSSSYQPGERVAIAGPHAYVLGDADPSSASIRRAWTLLQGLLSPADLAELVEGRDGLASVMENFGVVAQLGDRIRVTVKGDTVAVVSADDSTNTLRCPTSTAVASFTLLSTPDSLTMSVEGIGVPAEPGLPLSGGVVTAGSLVVHWREHLEPASAVAPAPPVMSDPPAARAAAPAAARDPALTIAPETPDEEDDDKSQPEAVDSEAVDSEAVDSEAVAGPPATHSSVDADSDGGYDHLFGHTINRVVEEAAIRAEHDQDHGAAPLAQAPAGATAAGERMPAETAPTEAARPTTGAEPSAPRSGSDEPAVLPGPPVKAPANGMIESVPFAGGPGPLGSAAATRAWDTEARRASTPDVDEQADMTISRSAREALLGQMGAPGNLAPIGPFVHAVRCPHGHLNPPHVERCRNCTTPIREQAPITVPRPVLGVLRLSTGDDIALDRSVLIGRSPSSDHLVEGERPHVVRVPSPGQDVSRDHLEVRIDGWHVLVTDLHSTNGTMVVRPGTDPERLRPDNPMMIEPGTVVSLAEEISFTFVAGT